MTRHVSVPGALAWSLLIALVPGACTPGESPPLGGTRESAQPTVARDPSVAAGQEVSVVFESEPDPPATGDNTFEVTVKRPDGSPVTDATVTTELSMPAMPSMNMPAMRTTATLAHDAAGRYRGTGRLSMGGTWNVIVTVSRGSNELGRKSFSIVAR